MRDRSSTPAEAKARPREEWKGMALSVALHALLLLAALWYLSQRPVIPHVPLRFLPVDLVVAVETTVPGPGTTQAAPARVQVPQRQDSTPIPQGTRPDSAKPPVDELTARLQALARMRQPDSALPQADNDGPGGNGRGRGSYRLEDYVRAQILRHWWPDLSLPGAYDMPVAVRVTLRDTGIIDDVEILDQARFMTDKPFRAMALSARNAAMLASPIEMPPGRQPKVRFLTIDLDPKAVLR